MGRIPIVGMVFSRTKERKWHQVIPHAAAEVRNGQKPAKFPPKATIDFEVVERRLQRSTTCRLVEKVYESPNLMPISGLVRETGDCGTPVSAGTNNRCASHTRDKSISLPHHPSSAKGCSDQNTRFPLRHRRARTASRGTPPDKYKVSTECRNGHSRIPDASSNITKSKCSRQSS